MGVHLRIASFGFVEIEDDEEAVRAMLILDGEELLGRLVKVSTERERSGGRGQRG